MKLYLIAFLTLVIGNALADTVVTLQGGMLQLNQPEAERHQVTPRGTLYGAGVGMRREYLELEALLLKGNAKDDIRHDGAANEMVHEQTSLVFAMNFYIKKWLYARLGYGLHRIKQSFSEPMSEASLSGANDAYGIHDSDVSEGMVFGGGVVIYDGKNFQAGLQLENFNYTSMKSSAWNGSLLLRFYFN